MTLTTSNETHLVRAVTLGKSRDDFRQISPFFRKRYSGFEFDRHFHRPEELEDLAPGWRVTLFLITTELLPEINATSWRRIRQHGRLILVVDPVDIDGFHLLFDAAGTVSPVGAPAIKQARQWGDFFSDRITLSNQEFTRFARPEEIIMCQADNVYTTVFFTDGTKLLISQTLKSVTRQFATYPEFVRVHQSYLINLNHLIGILRKDGSILQLSGKLQASISRDRLPRLSTLAAGNQCP